MRNILLCAVLLVMPVLITACGPTKTIDLEQGGNSEIRFVLPGANPNQDQSAESGQVAGFGTGVWHGLISVVTLVWSFFNPAVQMYEVHNNGPMYNLGFLLGTMLVFVLLGFTGGRRR